MNFDDTVPSDASGDQNSKRFLPIFHVPSSRAGKMTIIPLDEEGFASDLLGRRNVMTRFTSVDSNMREPSDRPITNDTDCPYEGEQPGFCRKHIVVPWHSDDGTLRATSLHFHQEPNALQSLYSSWRSSGSPDTSSLKRLSTREVNTRYQTPDGRTHDHNPYAFPSVSDMISVVVVGAVATGVATVVVDSMPAVLDAGTRMWSAHFGGGPS